jgi:hypothetical protein
MQGPDQLRIICTDQGTHPSRELALIWHHGEDPELLAGLLADDQLSEAEARTVYNWDRTSYLAQRRAARGGYVHGGVVDVGDESDGRGPLWRFRCPTCRRDVQLRDDKMRRLVEGLLAAGRVSVDISQLPASLS